MELTHTRLLVDCFKDCFIFYRDVLGLEPIWGNEQGRYADFRTGSSILAIYERQEMAKSIEGSYSIDDQHIDRAVVVFKVENVDESFDRLKSKVKFIVEPTSTPYGIRSANFRDPAGTLIEIYHEIPME